MTRKKTGASKVKKRRKVSKLRRLIKVTCQGKEEGSETADDSAEELEGEAGDSEEEEPQTKRPRQIRDKRPDVFAIPPSACDATVFRMQQPFMDVAYTKNVKFPKGDRVRGGSSSMDVEALKYAISVMSKEYILASMTSHAPASELAIRDLHVALIKSFWWLTRPRREHTMDTDEYFAAKECESEKKPGGIEDGAGLEIEVDTHASEQTARMSSDSLDVRLEGDEGEGEEKSKKTTRYDIKCQVYDERIEGMDKSIAALIVECKWASLSVEDIFQVASYACEAMKKNMEKGNTNPLHIEVWSESMWRYAVLYPYGLIEVQGQSIVDMKGSLSSKESLSKELKNRKMSDRYRVEYPDGQYLQGLLYVSNEKFSLPGTYVRGSFVGPESRLFFESKLRILVGERVLRWTIDDVKKAAQVCKQAFKEKRAMLLDG